MRLRWPWERDKKPEGEVVDGVVRSPIIEEERKALVRDLGQVKNVNRHTLARALARGWITEEEAEAIRSIQMDSGLHEINRKEMLGGTDPPAA